MTATDVVVVLTTFPADRDPDQLATTLVEEGLAACVNVLPTMRSVYVWKGGLETADERQLVIKTTRARVDELKVRLLALHPYELPEMLVLPVLDGLDSYLSWIVDSTSNHQAVDP